MDVDGGARAPEGIEADTSRSLLNVIQVPAGKGRAFIVRRGQVLRITQSFGPQVVDFNAFSLDDPRERFASGRTRILEGAHLTTGHRLWSTPPRTRPMFRIVRDTVSRPPLPHGAAPHDLLYSRCDRGFWKIIRGVENHPNCQDNLAEAIAPFGLPPEAVHDALNLFMVTGIDDQDRLFHLPPVSRQGDFVELEALMDCIVALSACPGGTWGQVRGVEAAIYV